MRYIYKGTGMNKQVLGSKKYIGNRRKVKLVNSRRGMGKVSKEITCDKKIYERESEKERETVPPKVASINPLLCGLNNCMFCL